VNLGFLVAERVFFLSKQNTIARNRLQIQRQNKTRLTLLKVYQLPKKTCQNSVVHVYKLLWYCWGRVQCDLLSVCLITYCWGRVQCDLLSVCLITHRCTNPYKPVSIIRFMLSRYLTIQTVDVDGLSWQSAWLAFLSGSTVWKGQLNITSFVEFAPAELRCITSHPDVCIWHCSCAFIYVCNALQNIVTHVYLTL